MCKSEHEEKFGFNACYFNNVVIFLQLLKKNLTFYFNMDQGNVFKKFKKTFILTMSSITLFIFKF